MIGILTGDEIIVLLFSSPVIISYSFINYNVVGDDENTTLLLNIYGV